MGIGTTLATEAEINQRRIREEYSIVKEAREISLYGGLVQSV